MDCVSLKELLHYEPSTGLFYWKRLPAKTRNRKPGDVAGYTDPQGYIKIKIAGRLYMAHRLAWLYVHAEWPTSSIDHINGARDDNRLLNLRVVAPAVNSQNRKGANSNSLTGLIGVSKHGRGYRASIWKGKKLERIGPFDTPEEAHAAYLDAKRLIHPEAVAIYPAAGWTPVGA